MKPLNNRKPMKKAHNLKWNEDRLELLANTRSKLSAKETAAIFKITTAHLSALLRRAKWLNEYDEKHRFHTDFFVRVFNNSDDDGEPWKLLVQRLNSSGDVIDGNSVESSDYSYLEGFMGAVMGIRPDE